MATEAVPPERRGHPRSATRKQAVLHRLSNDGTTVSEPVRMQDASANGMAIRLSKELAVGQTVWIANAEESPVKAVVRQCKRAGKGFVAGLFLVRIERRRSDRQPLQHQATLHWEDTTEGALSSAVLVRNTSDEGYQIETAARVPVAMIVRLAFNTWECVGFTHYCRPVEDGKYLVGLHITREPYPIERNGVERSSHPRPAPRRSEGIKEPNPERH